MSSIMKFEEFVFPDDEVKYITPNWDEVQELSFRLAQDIRQSGVKFDRIVTLAKGGWPMTRSLVDFLEVPDVASVGVKFYQGINRRMSRPEVYQDLPVRVKGEKVLLFDDVADTGESFEFTLDYLKGKGVEDVVTASLFLKPKSHFRPDFYAATTDAWIIFPYERIESLKILDDKWSKAGIDKAARLKRFKQLGFKQLYLSQYFS